MTPTLILIIVLVVLGLYVAGAYNKFVKLTKRAEEAWAVKYQGVTLIFFVSC